MTTATLDRPLAAAAEGLVFYQCDLRQGDKRVTGWIEKRGAKRGARVEIKGEPGLWDVVAVYNPPLDQTWLRKKQDRDRKGLPSLRDKK